LFKVQQKLSATLGRLVGEMPPPQLRRITEFLCWRHTPPLLLLVQKALVQRALILLPHMAQLALG
jgi:hypothetical protein